jgi:hypothetical protein
MRQALRQSRSLDFFKCAQCVDCARHVFLGEKFDVEQASSSLITHLKKFALTKNKLINARP